MRARAKGNMRAIKWWALVGRRSLGGALALVLYRRGNHSHFVLKPSPTQHPLHFIAVSIWKSLQICLQMLLARWDIIPPSPQNWSVRSLNWLPTTDFFACEGMVCVCLSPCLQPGRVQDRATAKRLCGEIDRTFHFLET